MPSSWHCHRSEDRLRKVGSILWTYATVQSGPACYEDCVHFPPFPARPAIIRRIVRGVAMSRSFRHRASFFSLVLPASRRGLLRTGLLGGGAAMLGLGTSSLFPKPAIATSSAT